MTDFRPGDIVTIELEVQAPELWGRRLVAKAADASFCLGPEAFGHLRDAGKVTLVRRAEPDWQVGEFARHIATGEMFRYLPDKPEDKLCWLYCGPAQNAPRWRTRDGLAGKLVRCTVTPEVTPQDAAEPSHVHLCRAGTRSDHRWTHYVDSSQCDGWVETCKEHREVTS